MKLKCNHTAFLVHMPELSAVLSGYSITGDILIARYPVTTADRPQGLLGVYKMFSETGPTMSWYFQLVI